MASIPLPALGIKTQQETPLEQYGKVVSLRNLMQQQQLQRQAMQTNAIQQQHMQMQNQLQAQQLKDQQTTMGVLQKYNGDLDKAIPELSQSVSAPTFMQLQKFRLDTRKTLSEIDEKELKVKQNQADQLAGLINQAQQMSPDQYTQQWPQLAASAKAIRPDLQVDPNNPIPQQQLGQLGIGVLTQKHYLDQESANRATAELRAKLPGEQANSQIKEAEAKSIASGGMTQQMADSKYRALQQKLAGGQAVTPDDQNFIKAYEKQRLLVPVASANIRMEGFGKIRQFPVYDNQTKQTIYMDSNEINDAKLREPGRFTVPQYTPEQIGQKSSTAYFTRGAGGKQLTAFNTAIAHLDTLDRLAGDLNNTNIQVANRAKQAWAKQTGNPAPANFEAAKNAMSGEVGAALKASGATDQEIAIVGATFSRAQSPAQLKGAINTYRELLKSKAQQLQGQYNAGMQGKPNFQLSQPPAQTGSNNDPLGIR